MSFFGVEPEQVRGKKIERTQLDTKCFSCLVRAGYSDEKFGNINVLDAYSVAEIDEQAAWKIRNFGPKCEAAIRTLLNTMAQDNK